MGHKERERGKDRQIQIDTEIESMQKKKIENTSADTKTKHTTCGYFFIAVFVGFLIGY